MDYIRDDRRETIVWIFITRGVYKNLGQNGSVVKGVINSSVHFIDCIDEKYKYTVQKLKNFSY